MDYKAGNRVDLLFPPREGLVYKIKKIPELPKFYPELAYLEGHLPVGSTVYLEINRIAFRECYKIECEKVKRYAMPEM